MATLYTQRSYSESDRSKEAKKKLDDHEAAQPGPYESDWMNALNSAMEAVLNRPAFQYDPGQDPLYQLQRDHYVNLGRMAMEDTMGTSAGLTGGYSNSYADLAGQQAYYSQLQGLNSLVPQLYSMALDMYDRQGQDLMNQYGLLYDRENLDYSRYRDGLNQWQDQRDYLTGRYDAERGFDYTDYRNMVADDQWKAAFDEDIRRFDFANKLGEFALSAGSVGGASSRGGSGIRTTKPKTPKEEEKKNTSYLPKIVIPSRVSPGRLTHESY